MSSKPVRIAQISDLHIKSPGALAYGRVDTAKALERCVAALNEFRPAPDFVVISGDLADTPTSEEYDYLKRLLAPLQAAVCRHSRQSQFARTDARAFPQADYASASGPLNQRVEIGGLDLVLLDSSVPGKPHGELEAPTLQWLRGDAGVVRRSAGAAVPAPSAVQDRHLAHGSPEPAQCERSRADRPAPSARAADRHRPRSSRDLHDVRGRADHDLSGSQSCGRSRSCSSCGSRRSRSSRQRFISTAGFQARDLAASSPIKSRSAILTARIRFSDRTGSCYSPIRRQGAVRERAVCPRLPSIQTAAPRCRRGWPPSVCRSGWWWRRRDRPDVVPRGSDGRCRARSGWRRPAPPDAAVLPA